MQSLPSPHGDKIRALLSNQKLPQTDVPLIEKAIAEYDAWIAALLKVDGNYEAIIFEMGTLLNQYKRVIEIDIIFDSQEDFLYRQKGQLKIDNSIIEEFLPYLISTALSEHLSDLEINFGPTTCYSGMRFGSSIKNHMPGGGLILREKDHDFAISRSIYVQSSHTADFKKSSTKQTNIAYIAAECKTNLDKTMFQEAASTALDIKTAVPGAKYFLLCDWLDMSPISTSSTAIDEIIILRKAKRVSANVRSNFSTVQGRSQNRALYVDYLTRHPVATEALARFVDHVKSVVVSSTEDDILEQGYF